MGDKEPPLLLLRSAHSRRRTTESSDGGGLGVWLSFVVRGSFHRDEWQTEDFSTCFHFPTPFPHPSVTSTHFPPGLSLHLPPSSVEQPLILLLHINHCRQQREESCLPGLQVLLQTCQAVDLCLFMYLLSSSTPLQTYCPPTPPHEQQAGACWGIYSAVSTAYPRLYVLCFEVRWAGEIDRILIITSVFGPSVAYLLRRRETKPSRCLQNVLQRSAHHFPHLCSTLKTFSVLTDPPAKVWGVHHEQIFTRSFKLEETLSGTAETWTWTVGAWGRSGGPYLRLSLPPPILLGNIKNMVGGLCYQLNKQ